MTVNATPGHPRTRQGLRPPTTGPDGAEPAVLEALPQALRVVGSVIAPTTLLTGLLFYFGRLHATAMFQYFGLHFTVLDLSVQDYLVRSADGLPLPMVAVLGVALLALWTHRLLARVVPAGRLRRVVGVGAPVTAIAGAALVVLAVADTVGVRFFAAVPEARGLALSVGVLLLAYAGRLARIRTGRIGRPSPSAQSVVAEWGIVFILVSVGLFWAVGSYAVGVGTGRAQQIADALASQPDVALYSEKDLGLEGPGVRRTPCTAPDTAYRMRYDGLRLVLQSGGQYLLLPVDWTPDDGPALLVARSAPVRLEFRRTGPLPAPTC